MKLLLSLALLAGLLCSCEKREVSTAPPKLILQITVDGLRGDLLEIHRHHLGPDGFNRIIDRGTWYSNAHYHHANTETIVGHSTLATGAPPSVHGMIGNAWYNRSDGQLGYNVEDPDYPLLPTREVTKEQTQVDPAQKGVRSDGRSPRKLLAPTFSDTLLLANYGDSRIFAVSGKDRGAIPLAGQGGKAFWFSPSSTDFVTSKYYYETYPDWATEWNALRLAESHANTEWALSGPAEDYRRIQHDERPYEVDLGGYRRSFPHPFGPLDHPLFPTRLLVSPVGDQLTASFAAALLKGEDIGKDDTTDFVSVSFSSVDAVNHFFGPASLECEDTIRQLDRTLAELLDQVDRQVGLEHTLIVLSADHGMPVMPEYATELGFPAGRIDPKQVVDAANAAGRTEGIDQVVRAFYRPYLYLDHQAIKEAGKDMQELLSIVAIAVEDLEGIELAVPSDPPPDTPPLQRISRNHHPERSGDIYVAQSPYWFLFDKGPVACIHGSPWAFDTHVPVIFSGPGIDHNVISRPVRPEDVAPTLAAYLGLSPPAAATGQVLEEVVESFR